MIRLNQSHHQIRIDTTIKIIEKDGTEVTAPVMVIIDLKKIQEKHQHNIYKLSNSIFNKMFLLNRIKIAQAKETPIKKSWYKFW